MWHKRIPADPVLHDFTGCFACDSSDVTHAHMCHMCHDPFTCDMPHSYVTVSWYICDMTHSYVWHDSFICVTWLIHMCDMTHSYVWHDSFICVTWLIHMCDMTHSYPYQQTEPWTISPDASCAESWHICMSHGTYEWVMAYMIESYKCVMPHMNVTYQQTEPWTISPEASRVSSWHVAHPSQSHARQPIMRAPFTTDPSHQLHLRVCDMTHWCAARHINMCDVTDWYVWHDLCLFVPRLLLMCDMTQQYAAGIKKSVICASDSLIRGVTHWCVTWFMDICAVANLSQSTPTTFVWSLFVRVRVMNWNWNWNNHIYIDIYAVANHKGCLKLQVIFRQRATNYKALLRKMTHKDKASYGSSPRHPFTTGCRHIFYTQVQLPSHHLHLCVKCVTWLIHVRDMTPSYVTWLNSYVTWLIDMWHGTG